MQTCVHTLFTASQKSFATRGWLINLRRMTILLLSLILSPCRCFFLQKHTPKRLDRYAHYDSDTHTLAYDVRLLSARSACRPSCRQPGPEPAIGDRCTWFMRFTYQRTDEARWCADNDRCSDIDRDIDTSQACCGRMSRWACAAPLK